MKEQGILSLLLTLALVLCAGVGTAAAQTAPDVRAQLSSGILKQGGVADITLTYEGRKRARITALPAVDGLKFGPISGPMSRRFSTFSRGRQVTTMSLTWSVAVRAERIGDYMIPAITLEVDGQQILTQEMQLRVVRDLKGENLGFFEVRRPPNRIYEGQPYDLDLTFGWDTDLEVTGMGLYMPWWKNQRGVLGMELRPSPSAGLRRVAIEVNRGDRVHVAELPKVKRDKRVFDRWQLRLRYTATRPGTLEFGTSYFEFQRPEANAPRRSVFQSVKLERFYVPLAAFTVEVLPIPEKGRPFEWTGAVGTLEAEREVNRRDVDVGDSIKLRVVWRGLANLEFFDAPDLMRLDDFEGFRVLGTEDVFLTDERIVTYDLVPTSAELAEIPSVPLWIFDTDIEEYRKVETGPIPIRVRAIEGEEMLEAIGERGPVFDLEDIVLPSAAGTLGDDSSRRIGGRTLFGAMASSLLAWLLLRTFIRKRLGDPDSAQARRRRAARRSLSRALGSAQDSAAQAAVVHRFLAARTREAQQAWVGRDAGAWADSLELPDRLRPALQSLDKLLRELDAHSYGVPSDSAGGGSALQRERILSVIDELLRGGL